MAEAEKEKKSLSGKVWDGVKTQSKEAFAGIGEAFAQGVQHARDDIGSTYQACLWNGWHTQSASIESPEHLSEQLAKDQENKKLEAEKSGPKVGLDKE